MRQLLLVFVCLIQVFAHSALSLEYWTESSGDQLVLNQPD